LSRLLSCLASDAAGAAETTGGFKPRRGLLCAALCRRAAATAHCLSDDAAVDGRTEEASRFATNPLLGEYGEPAP